MRRLLVWVAIAFAVAACATPANASPPFRADVHPDTGQSVQVILSCPAAGANVSCQYSNVIDSVSHTNLTPQPVTVLVGQSVTLTLACSGALAQVAVGGQVVGLNQSGTASAPAFGGARGRCNDVAPTTPVFVIRLNGGS